MNLGDRVRAERLRQQLADPKSVNPVRRALVLQFFWPMMRFSVTKFFNSTIQFAPPLFLWQLLLAIQNGDRDIGFAWAVGLFVAVGTKTFIENAYFQGVVKVCNSASF